MKDFKMSCDEHPMTSALSMHRMNVRRNCVTVFPTLAQMRDERFGEHRAQAGQQWLVLNPELWN